MRLLTQKDCETPKYLDDGIPIQKIYDIFDDVFSHISHICNIKGCTQEIFGVAMTLFHYYTYFKSFREFDRLEIAVACVFLACKIEFSFMRMDEAANFYYNIKKNKTHTPDFIKFEIEVISFLGFDIIIETPHKYFYYYLEKKYCRAIKETKIINMGNRLINDFYRKNLCVYYSSNYIALASLFISLWVTEQEDDFNKLMSEVILLEKGINATMFKSCLDNLFKTYEGKFYYYQEKK